MLKPYTPHNWFWIVGGDASKAWSSAVGAYVSSWDADRLTRIANEAELSDVLRVYGLKGPHVSGADVDAERDRRASSFVFDGKSYDLGGQSLVNVAGAGTMALAAIINGAQAGDYRWSDPEEDFAWIAKDNTKTKMDAQTCWAFSQTAAAWRKHCIFKARVLKDKSPIPADYAADSHWE